jgi:glutamyl-tRNA synthetase
VDDFVIRRGDGTPSYNVAVVVDDHDAGIGQVVRGDDLIGTTPRQVLVARLLGIAPPRHLHVPLVVEPDGERLAKRSGSVTLAALAERGIDVEAVRSVLAQSLALADADEATRPSDLLARFDPGAIPRARWVLTPVLLGEGDCLDPPHRRP